jgi:hypothetical protein
MTSTIATKGASSSEYLVPVPEAFRLQEQEQDERGHGKWEGKQKGKSDKRITGSKGRQNESTTFCTNLAD